MVKNFSFCSQTESKLQEKTQVCHQLSLLLCYSIWPSCSSHLPFRFICIYSHLYLFTAQDSDSDLMDMADDTEFNHFLDKDSLNGPHLSNGKVKMPLGTSDVVMPQLKPPPPNTSPRDPKLKASLTKDGRLQKKRGPKPGPRNSTANKKPRLTSTRPVPKMVLKNLKVGTVETGAGSGGKNGSAKVCLQCLK